MANKEHIDILNQGIISWNAWRESEPLVIPDFSNANLKGMDLNSVNFAYADLNNADLSNTHMTGANLFKANLANAKLHRCYLRSAILNEANLVGANLSKAMLSTAELINVKLHNANLRSAYLRKSRLIGANLSNAFLEYAVLSEVNIENAILTGCHIYGTSTWNVKGQPLSQSNLVITPKDAATVTVDNLELAQFIFLLLDNVKIRDVIETVGKKGVLILGRFSEERKPVLDILKDELRKKDFVPMLFDFEKPSNRDLTETISTLAHISRFVIADITNAKSIPQELRAIIPNLPSLPIQPIILSTEFEYSMFADFASYFAVLPLFQYKSIEHLVTSLKEFVIAPAIQKAKEIEARRSEFEKMLVSKR